MDDNYRNKRVKQDNFDSLNMMSFDLLTERASISESDI